MSESAYRDRDQRILDTVAELVLRWGAKRVTIDEVARRAGIGKGTVYLHFESRTRLLAAVLMRESIAITDELIAAMEQDPSAVLPSEQARLTYLATRARPLSWAMMSRDRELLGELAHEAAVQPLWTWSREVGRACLQVLRDHELLRADLDHATHELIFNATQAGFYLHPAGIEAEPAATAAALRTAIAGALEPADPPDAGRLATAAAAAIAHYRPLRDRLAEEIDRRPTRTK
ncbi:TetR/AcrR family transcriptional regulator [Microlunatus sp. GCM10028923]|uniref:TetR/AcrR family transcriptional regulator n=1 Tax=Microlunatus sp. GCM10028923 TaxID=3273400 RepID=UPI0036119C9A